MKKLDKPKSKGIQQNNWPVCSNILRSQKTKKADVPFHMERAVLTDPMCISAWILGQGKNSTGNYWDNQ